MKEVKINKQNIDFVMKKCKQCKSLPRIIKNPRQSIIYKNNRIMSDPNHSLFRAYPKKCSVDTIDKINKIDESFLKTITTRKNLIVEILDRKNQILVNCISN